jgi:hypothetical protein
MNLTLERPVTFMEEKIGHPICLFFCFFRSRSEIGNEDLDFLTVPSELSPVEPFHLCFGGGVLCILRFVVLERTWISPNGEAMELRDG